MWYVNTFVAGDLTIIAEEFYINYVVCKYHSLLTQETRLVRFILTMWYVNNSFKKEYTIFREGFILTMWYVNY